MNTPFSHRISLAVLLLAAALLLLASAYSSYTSTFDTGTVGLMSVNIVHGEHPLFFYGQPYFGALEAYVAALFVALFGFSEFAVTLSPITFTLGWILFTYLLFARIHTPTTGLIAALCTAFPGYYVAWYSIATYGGYPAIFCLGTATLWLALRMVQEEMTATRRLIIHAMALGGVMALGIWVHPLIFPYIIVGGGLLILFAVRERLRPHALLALTLIGAVALLGFLPFYLETGSLLGGLSSRTDLSWQVIGQALVTLFSTNIFELVVWNFQPSFETPLTRTVINSGSLIALGIAGLLAVTTLFTTRNPLVKKRLFLVPLSFCLLFLLLYVQHHLATVKAPRYAISFWSMLLCTIWCLALCGQSRRSIKIMTVSLFAVWIAYQLSGTILFMQANVPGTLQKKRAVQAVVTAAREQHLKTVVTFGGHHFGLMSPTFSMFSENRIPFANADMERYPKNAQAAEADDNRGYLTTAASRPTLQNSLKNLGVSYDVETIENYVLFTGLRSGPHYTMQAITQSEIHFATVAQRGSGFSLQSLGDGSQDPTIPFPSQQETGVIADLGTVRQLCGLWMFAPQNPRSLRSLPHIEHDIFISTDGVEYHHVYSAVPHAVNGYHAGSHLMIGGPWGKVESMFAPARARYVKVVFAQPPETAISEMFFFETDGTIRQETTGDIEALHKIIEELDLDFVLADRWVSARLRQLFINSRKQDIALPRHSNEYYNKPARHFITPRKGNALVCDNVVADACAHTLIQEYGASVIARRRKLQEYTLFVLADADINFSPGHRSALLWNGHVVLRTKQLDLLALWANSLGYPLWRPDTTHTKGIRHDAWTNGDATLSKLDYTIDPTRETKLVLYTNGWRPDNDAAHLRLKVIVNNHTPLQFRQQADNVFTFSLPATLQTVNTINIQSTTFIPSTRDPRKLGINIDRIEIE